MGLTCFKDYHAEASPYDLTYQMIITICQYPGFKH